MDNLEKKISNSSKTENFIRKAGYRITSAICAIGLAGALYLAGIGVYTGIKETINLQKNPIENLGPNEPSPYSDVHLMGIMVAISGIGATAFGIGFVDSIKKAREINEE